MHVHSISTQMSRHTWCFQSVMVEFWRQNNLKLPKQACKDRIFFSYAQPQTCTCIRNTHWTLYMSTIKYRYVHVRTCTYIHGLTCCSTGFQLLVCWKLWSLQAKVDLFQVMLQLHSPASQNFTAQEQDDKHLRTWHTQSTLHHCIKNSEYIRMA